MAHMLEGFWNWGPAEAEVPVFMQKLGAVDGRNPA